jgi:hypothetical protein
LSRLSRKIITVCIGRWATTVGPFPIVKLSRVFPNFHPRFVSRVEPRPAVEPFEAISGAQIDHIPPVGGIAELDPLVPEPGGLHQRIAIRIGQCPAE